ERHDVAAFGVAGLLAGHAHRQVALATIAVDRDLALDQALHPGAGSRDQVSKLWSDLVELPAECLRLGMTDQPFGGPVEDADAALGVDTNDASTRARQDRFSEAAAAIDEVA